MLSMQQHLKLWGRNFILELLELEQFSLSLWISNVHDGFLLESGTLYRHCIAEYHPPGDKLILPEPWDSLI